MNKFSIKSLQTILSKHGDKFDEITRTLASMASEYFQKEFCRKYYLDIEIYHNLDSLAFISQNPKENSPAKMDKMIMRECKQTGMSRERIISYIDRLKGNNLHINFIMKSKDENELFRVLNIYFQFFEHEIGPETKIENFLAESLREYLKKEMGEDEEEKEAKIFDLKTGERINPGTKK